MIINTLLRMENLLDLSGLKKIHRSKRDALYTFFFFFLLHGYKGEPNRIH